MKGLGQIIVLLVFLVAVVLYVSVPVDAAKPAKPQIIEIHQAIAEEGGVTPGDTPGFPITISGSGSYALTSDLFVDDPDLAVIEVTAVNDVTIDLRGFALVGPTECTSAINGLPPISCAPTGSGDGIRAFGVRNLTVRNGSVTGMGRNGLSLNSSAVIVENLQVSSNGGDGMFAGWSCIVTHSSASLNGGDGIETGDDCTVAESVAVSNGETGISTGTQCLVRGCTASRNDSGVLARGGSTVLATVAARNTAEGLLLNPIAGYANNTLTQNNGNSFGSDANPEVAGGIEIGSNLCGSDTVCP